LILGNLFLQVDVLVSLPGVSGDGDTGNGQFNAEGEFHRSCNDSIEAKDFFFAVGIFRVSSYSDAGFRIRW